MVLVDVVESGDTTLRAKTEKHRNLFHAIDKEYGVEYYYVYIQLLILN